MEKLRHSFFFHSQIYSICVCLCVCNFMHQTISKYTVMNSLCSPPPFPDDCGNMQNNYFDCILCTLYKRVRIPLDDDDDKVQLKECPLIFLSTSFFHPLIFPWCLFSLQLSVPHTMDLNASKMCFNNNNHDLSLVLVWCNCWRVSTRMAVII